VKLVKTLTQMTKNKLLADEIAMSKFSYKPEMMIWLFHQAIKNKITS
jgi:hypothetical protein